MLILLFSSSVFSFLFSLLIRSLYPLPKVKSQVLWYNITMKILSEEIRKADLIESDVVFGGEMVKGVVDVEQGLLAIDAEMHADLEKLLLENGSSQENLWGINLYPEFSDEDFVEFDSMINIRPRQNNRSRYVEDEAIRNRIIEVVAKWVR